MRPFGLLKLLFMAPVGHEKKFTLLLIQLGD